MIKEYVVSIISISVIGLVLDTILPDGNIKKYGNFAFSIILSIILIQPVTKIFDLGSDFNFNYEKYQFDYTQAVQTTVNSISGFENAAVYVEQESNKIKSITINLKGEKVLEKVIEESKKEYVKKILSALYGTDNICFSG